MNAYTMVFQMAHQSTEPGVGVIDVSLPAGRERTLFQALTSVAAATGIALLVPFAILLVGSPIALAVRALIDAIVWMLNRLA